MKRLIANILVLVLLTTQSAWAVFGNSLDEDSQHKERVVERFSSVASGQAFDSERTGNHVDEHGHAPHDASANACDHFCHGGVHLQGMFSYNRIIFDSISNVFDRIVVNIKLSMSEPPVNPPPIF